MFTFLNNAIITIPSIKANNINPDQECYPLFPTEQTIILRMDDLQAYAYGDFRFKILDEILDRDMSIIVGVVPEKLELDTKLKKYLINHRTNPNFEIAQHGYEHTLEEFKNLSDEDSLIRLKTGHQKILDSLGIYPTTFIPPYNEYSQSTIEALKKLNFKVVSARKDEYFFSNNIFHIGKNAETYDFTNNKGINVEEIVSICKKSLDLKNLCMIVIHPQDFLDKDFNVEQERYGEFIKLLNELEKLNVSFKVPRDLIFCN